MTALLQRLCNLLNRRASWLLAGVLLLGVAVRLASLAAYPCTMGYWSRIYLDEWDYDSLARNILEQHSYHCCTEGFLARATRPPGYPFALAAFYSIVGRNLTAVRVLQAFLDSLNILLVYLIVRSARFAPLVALVSAFFVALYGPLVNMVPYMHDIVLSSVLFNLFFLLFLTGDNQPAKGAACGAIGGLCALVRPSFLAVAAGSAIAFYTGKASIRQRLATTAAFVGVFAAVTAPWAVRSSVVTGAPVALTTAPAWHFYAFGLAHTELPVEEPVRLFFSRAVPDEGELYKEGLRRAASSFASQPLHCVKMGMSRFAGWLGGAMRPGRVYKPQAYVAMVGYGPLRFPLLDIEGLVYVTVLATVAVLAWKRRAPLGAKRWGASWRPLLLPALLYALPHILLVPMTQHRLMLEPVALAAAISWMAVLAGGDSAFGSPPPQLSSEMLRKVCLTAASTCALVLALAIAQGARASPPRYVPSYRGAGPTYSEVRRVQRQLDGELGPLTGSTVVWQGTIEYPASGWRFVPGKTLDSMLCAPNDDTCVARLAMLGSEENAPGETNVRLNIPIGFAPHIADGKRATVRGTLAGTTCFGSLVVEVEDIVLTDH
jgi:hypothetical protein